MSIPQDELLTTQQAAEIAGLTDSRIRQLLIEGTELHGAKFGRQWMIRRSELERWLEQRKRER